MRSILFPTLMMGAMTLFSSCVEASSSAGGQTSSDKKRRSEIYLAGGCFWGTEHYLKQIRGIIDTEVGYANGNIPDPDYKTVCTGKTGFAETVHVVYDPDVISLDLLLDLYYDTIDPTSHNRQGNDVGDQYRTGIYFTNPADEAVIKASLARLATKYSKPIAVECLPLKNFYLAEEYHRDYLEKHPDGYCHIPWELMRKAREANPPTPKKREFSRKDDATLRRTLTPLQYDVTQRGGTERAFANEYWDETREGIYVDVTTGEPLFTSKDKFDSGCGWPAFAKPIDKALLQQLEDRSHGMVRTEVRSKTGDAHLGHVFNDGPARLGGKRYCINSAALRFIPKEEMNKKGYGDYLYLFEK